LLVFQIILVENPIFLLLTPT